MDCKSIKDFTWDNDFCNRCGYGLRTIKTTDMHKENLKVCDNYYFQFYDMRNPK